MWSLWGLAQWPVMSQVPKRSLPRSRSPHSQRCSEKISLALVASATGWIQTDGSGNQNSKIEGRGKDPFPSLL